MRTSERRAVAALGVVAVLWGSSFPLTRVVLDEVPTADFLAVRFAIAAALCAAVLHRHVLRLSRTDLWRSVVLGLLYGVAQVLQTEGLRTTPAAVSGFITGLYVVLTPLCAAVLLRGRIGRRVWAAAALATVGLGLLSLSAGLGIGSGELLTAASALVYALHIVALGAWARAGSAVGSSVVQLVVMAVLGTIAAAPGGIALPHSGAALAALLYLAVFSGALALIVQVWSQSQLDPSRAAIIMSSEPLWAAVISVGLFGEALTWRLVVGGVAILGAMALVELRPRSRRRGRDPAADGPLAPPLGEDLPSPPR